MDQTRIFAAESAKPLPRFVEDFAGEAQRRGFVLHNRATMDMGQTLASHGEAVGTDFDLHLIQLCKPSKAARSLQANPERAVLMPKFVAAFSRGGKTQVRLLTYGADLVGELLDDPAFPGSLAESFEQIRETIVAAC